MVHLGSGELQLGSIPEGLFLTIYKKMDSIFSATMIGSSLYSCVALSTPDAILRLPYGVNVALGMGLPKVARDNGRATLLPLHGGKSMAIASDQGLLVSYDPHRLDASSATLYSEKRAVLHNIGSPDDVTPPKTDFRRLPESAPWFRSNPPLFAAAAADIFVFVHRRNLIVTLYVVAKQSAAVVEPLAVLSKHLRLLATEDTVVAATVHDDTALVATTKGLWRVPLANAAKGMAHSETCYTSFKLANKWDDIEDGMFIGRTFRCSNGKSMDC